jgi:hypothetical protein
MQKNKSLKCIQINKMEDLTIIFVTINQVPDAWAEYHKNILLKAAGSYPIITVSKKPTPIGINLIDNGPKVLWNLYWQLLQAAKIAKTPYIAQAEDDTLYTPDHFSCFRPPLDTFAYNINRWSLYTWGTPMYSWRNSQVGAAGIFPRERFIYVLEERFAKYPDGIPTELCNELGLRTREAPLGWRKEKWVDYWSEDPVIQVNHDYFSQDNNGPEAIAKRHRKRHGFLRAFNIPYWGKASTVVNNFK